MVLIWLLAPGIAIADEIRFQVDLEAPDQLRELLEQHLDVVRRSSEKNINAEEVRRLYARAPEQIVQALGLQ